MRTILAVDRTGLLGVYKIKLDVRIPRVDDTSLGVAAAQHGLEAVSAIRHWVVDYIEMPEEN
jgi:hypothetical protein